MKPSYVLGISGSPRRNGNTELLIREFMRGAAAGGHKTELIVLSELKISPCTSCGSCKKTGKFAVFIRTKFGNNLFRVFINDNSVI